MAYQAEYLEARQTLALSARTASAFVAQFGALAPILIPPLPAATFGRRPGFQGTVLDQKYWFAKLYEVVTYEELNYLLHTQHPGFSLQFMKVFYGMYYDSLQKFQKHMRVAPLWQTHFIGPPTVHRKPVEPDSRDTVEYSVRTGAIAHIQGDMPVALGAAYKTWEANPKPGFQELREDFINKSEVAFRRAQARFYVEVNDKISSPMRPEVGQFAAASYQSLFHIQPSLVVMFQWRRDAWQKAASSL